MSTPPNYILGIDMYYKDSITREQVSEIPCETELTLLDEVFGVMESLIR